MKNKSPNTKEEKKISRGFTNRPLSIDCAYSQHNFTPAGIEYEPSNTSSTASVKYRLAICTKCGLIVRNREL